MKKLLAILLALLLFLTACGKTTTDPVPELPPEPAPPVVEAPTEIPSLSYRWENAATDRSWNDQIRLSAVIPVFTGENQPALDVVNQYYNLLLGKLLDYAEGDLTPGPGEKYTVTGQYGICLATEDVLSLSWTVHTAESGKNTATTTVRHYNFSPATGNLLTFRDLFRSPDAARSAFVRAARAQMENTPGYYEHIADLADSALDVDNFYYTENGIAVYYSADAVGVATAVELTWEDLAPYMET